MHHPYAQWPQSVLLFLSILFLCFSGCKDKTTEANSLPPETLAKYISGYSSGVIGKSDPMLVQFSQAVVAQEQIGQSVNEEWFDLSPSAAYTGIWRNTSTLELKPVGNWTGGTKFTLSIDLDEIFPEANIGQDFVTQIEIRKTQINLVFDGLYTPDEANFEKQLLRGVIQSNDDLSRVEGLDKIFVATQEGRQLTVEVDQTNGNSNRVDFRILGIERKAEATDLIVNWDASRVSGIGEHRGERTFSISSVDDFHVVSVEPKVDGAPYVEVAFTDPVDPSQNLNGLITIDGVDGLRFTKDANLIKVFLPGELEGLQSVRLDASIRNRKGITLPEPSEWQVTFTRPDPALEVASDGAIMPHTGQRLFPFKAIGLQAIRLEIFKIFGNNVQQFLGDHNLYGNQDSYGITQVGRIVHQEKIMLSSLKGDDYEMDKWNRFALDLGEFIQDEDRAIYQVRIGFTMEDARKECDKSAADYGIAYEPGVGASETQYIGFEQEPKSILGDYYGIYGSSYEDFSWRDRDNVCRPAYYNASRFICRNVLSSNLGLIVKQNNDRQTVVIVTDLLSGGPVAGAGVRFFDQQQQEIKNGSTDVDGRLVVETDQRPTFVMARYDGDVAYLEVNQSNALNTSRFPTGGQSVAGGVKGAFYAERGVWRPGDSIYLNFVLENKLLKLPPNYPISFTLTDARGSVREKRTVTPAAGQMYPLYLATDMDDPTGQWQASVEVGGKRFTKYLRIETIKPNRLKVNLEPAEPGAITSTNNTIDLEANWLHGAPAANMRALVLGQLQKAPDAFEESWPDYVFLDPARQLSDRDEQVLFDAELSPSGTASFSLPQLGGQLPGPMQMAFNTRVFEPGGDFSSDNVRYDLVNFSALAGLSLPEGRWGGKRLPMDTDNEVAVVAIDAAGKGFPNQQLEVGLYRVNWRYWWQDDNDDVARYNSSSHENALESYQVTTGSDGRTTVSVRTNRWGRYLLRVCNPATGHCAGDYFYSGSPRWTETDKDAAAMLPLRLEDKTYAIGETATITLESEQGGMALLSLENSSGVIETRWVQAQKGNTEIPVRLDETMLPTVYASVMLIQPHANTREGGPIRRYGVIPINVEDPKTRLTPQIATAEEYEPEESFTVTVSEADGQPMNYTLAVVDEGLLGLTRFKTPDLWNNFFGKEALTVKTYDLFNYVINSMDGQFNRILAVGGDGEGGPDSDKAKANRFEPVVMHLGPFSLKAGQKAIHDFTMPNYVGAVRVMVVAQGSSKYGKAEESVPVRKDLMVLPTLPRVLSPGESIELPVNVFAMTGKVKDVKVSVREESGLLTNEVARERAIRFDTPGDQLVRFPFKAGSETGVARFVVTASGNGESISQEIEIQVENPNAIETREDVFVLDAGATKVVDYTPFGTPSTRDISLEVSLLPNMNLKKHLNNLIRYPYGCVEQTTSSVFPQLHLAKLIEIDGQRESEIQYNIRAGIRRLQGFQLNNGALGYWRGSNSVSKWGTNYALHFLLEAEAAGYTLPLNMKDRLLDYQATASRNWRYSSQNNEYDSRHGTFYQAYRLFTLAFANRAELGAMNRLRGVKNLRPQVKAFLAAAYKLAGKQNIAKEMATEIEDDIEEYRELSFTYGSTIRDRAILLYALQGLSSEDKLGRIALKIANAVKDRNYLSTQEGAFVLLAFSKYLSDDSVSAGKQVKVNYKPRGSGSTELGSPNGLLIVELANTNGTQQFELTNNSGKRVYATLLNTAKPLPGEETVNSKGIKLDIAYTDLNDNPIDVSSLTSGTDFVAIYTVNRGTTDYRSIQNIALQQIAASGWEISNERMSMLETDTPEDRDRNWRTSNSFDYQDFRDDRVFTFFDLNWRSTNVYRLRMTAAYPGRYYLPTQVVEAMYDPEVRSGVKGQWVEVKVN